MVNTKDLTGKKFGRLTALKRLEYSKKCHSYYWECQCDCGNKIKVLRSHLIDSNTQSCGCLANESKKKNHIDLLNKRFGKILVTEFAGKDKYGHYLWKCKCDCGNEIIRTSSTIINTTRHCGCVKHSNAKKHGKRSTRLYRIWMGIKQRCLNPKSPHYKDYGGRGIKLFDDWLKFEPFYQWAVSNGYNDTLSIDRIDVNGNYEPSNCRWATRKEQANNTRRNILITFNNKKYTCEELAKLLGVTVSALYHKKNRGTLQKFLEGLEQ